MPEEQSQNDCAGGGNPSLETAMSLLVNFQGVQN